MISSIKSPRKISLVVCIGLTGAGLALAIWFLRVNSVYCYVQYANCPPEITASLQPLKGRRLLLFDLEEETKRLLQSNPNVRFEKLSKQLPGAVTVTLQSQRITYALKAVDSEAYAAISDEGVVVQSEFHSEWPVFLVSQSLLESVTTSGKVAESIQYQLMLALTALKSTNWPVTALHLPDWQTIEVELDQQPVLLFELAQLSNQLGRAQQILTQLPPETVAKTKEIDLRFKLPVLRETPTRSRQ